MTVFTLGFTQKNAETFFKLIKDNAVELLIDIRLNNTSQLAGFTKGDDLKYFLQEIAGCGYTHDLVFTPSKEIFDRIKSKAISWEEFETEYKKTDGGKERRRAFLSKIFAI